jgi:DNA invertase Pin-like site-specific DNA recombinase
VKIVKEIASGKDISNQIELRNIVNRKFAPIVVVYNISRFSRNVSQGLALFHKMREEGLTLESSMETFQASTEEGNLKIFNF